MKKKKDTIELTKEQKNLALNKIKAYCDENFGTELGNLETELFIDFLSETIGPYYYNQGLADSVSVMRDKLEDLYLLMKNEL